MTPMSVKTAQPAKGTDAPDGAPPRADFAGSSVPRHLVRGALGFGLVIGSIGLVPVVGPVSLLAAPLALIAFRGCPTCWLVGLGQTMSRGRLERTCVDGVCSLTPAHPAAGHAPSHPSASRPSTTSATTDPGSASVPRRNA
ncbi:hypothetical protein [Streptomyces luteocolor]|uniref:hypothetical protein n=1 Tax=Streptomyces luteocolor TaxID=285500 RepID=UPI003F77381E